MTLRNILVLSAILLLVAGSCDKKNNTSQSPDPIPDNWPTDSLRTVKSGLDFPWEVLWGKDDHLWVTERAGRISKIEPKTGNTVFTFTIGEVVTNGEGGLLGMVQHPDFLTNGMLYTVYDYTKNGVYLEKVVRFTFTNNTLTNPVTIFDNIPAASIHNGSRLWITGDSKLLVSTGDASNQSNPQNTASLSGKILRLNLDGSIPADNPISNNPVWSFGHRNPQGMVVVNNVVYTSEHGPDIEDEVNIIEKGRNYGWPNVKGPCDGAETSFCTANNVKAPIWSSGSSTVATSGMDYYNNDRIAKWKNSLLLATLKDATLYQLKLSTDGMTVVSVTQFFRGNWGRLRDVAVSPAGRVYLCTSNGGNNDRIIEIQK